MKMKLLWQIAVVGASLLFSSQVFAVYCAKSVGLTTIEITFVNSTSSGSNPGHWLTLFAIGDHTDNGYNTGPFGTSKSYGIGFENPPTSGIGGQIAADLPPQGTGTVQLTEQVPACEPFSGGGAAENSAMRAWGMDGVEMFVQTNTDDTYPNFSTLNDPNVTYVNVPTSCGGSGGATHVTFMVPVPNSGQSYNTSCASGEIAAGPLCIYNSPINQNQTQGCWNATYEFTVYDMAQSQTTDTQIDYFRNMP